VQLFQESALKGNALLYDSSKDPNIRKAYANLRAKTEQQKRKMHEADARSQPTNNLPSPTVTANPANTTSPRPKVSGSTQQQKRNGHGASKMGVNDINLLGEMIFGAIPMQIKGQNTKVHFLPQYRQTLLTKLFQVSIPGSWVSFEEDKKHQNHIVRRISQDDIPSMKSTPLDGIPIQNTSKQGVVLANTPDLSSMITTHHAFRRRSMSECHSIAFDLSSTSTLPARSDYSDDDSVSSLVASSKSEPSLVDSPKKKKRKKKRLSTQPQVQYLCKSLFALGVVFIFHDDEDSKDFLQQASQLQKLIFSHFAIIELRMRRLLKACSAAIKSYLRQAIHQTQQIGKLSSVIFHLLLLLTHDI
jgi:hypothetical protein